MHRTVRPRRYLGVRLRSADALGIGAGCLSNNPAAPLRCATGVACWAIGVARDWPCDGVTGPIEQRGLFVARGRGRAGATRLDLPKAEPGTGKRRLRVSHGGDRTARCQGAVRARWLRRAFPAVARCIPGMFLGECPAVARRAAGECARRAVRGQTCDDAVCGERRVARMTPARDGSIRRRGRLGRVETPARCVASDLACGAASRLIYYRENRHKHVPRGTLQLRAERRSAADRGR